MHSSSTTFNDVTYDGIAHDPRSTYNEKPVEGHVTGLQYLPTFGYVKAFPKAGR